VTQSRATPQLCDYLGWSLKPIEKDIEGIEFYVTRYREFRLLALRTDPSGELGPLLGSSSHIQVCSAS
jgi:hypothetical protein